MVTKLQGFVRTDRAMPLLDVTVSIVSWNRVELLTRCLDSVLRSTGSVSFEVIVVDNASQDGSVNVLLEQYPAVRTIANGMNVGFGRAHNQAMSLASGRYILVLNSDATLEPDTLERLVAFMDDHPRAGLSTCLVSRKDGGVKRSAGVTRFPSLTSEIAAGLLETFALRTAFTQRLIQKLSAWVYRRSSEQSDAEVAWVHGALLFLRARAFVDTGYFDERFFMYCEETDLCLRAQKAGWEVWSTSSCSYVHQGKGSVSLRNDRELLYGASGAAYFAKHFGFAHAIAFRVQHFILRRCLLSLRYFISEWIKTGTPPKKHRWLAGRFDESRCESVPAAVRGRSGEAT